MMTTKIAQLQKQLSTKPTASPHPFLPTPLYRVSELEYLYQNREPRPEDVESIRELQRQVRSLQSRLKEAEVSHMLLLRLYFMLTVQAEKQVYQLELVNREKNYNKIFNATPCVGVLDPLRHTKVRPPHPYPTPPHRRSTPVVAQDSHKCTCVSCPTEEGPHSSSGPPLLQPPVQCPLPGWRTVQTPHTGQLLRYPTTYSLRR